MSSQKDLFDDNMSDISGDRKITSSLPVYVYKWVIMFQWNILENKSRFKLFERVLFPEIKDEWIRGQLKAKSRAKKLKPFSAEHGTFSLFGKVEIGMYLLP